MESPTTDARAHEAGGSEVETLREKVRVLEEEQQALLQHIEYLERQVGIDYLTGLNNRKSFERNLEQSLKLVRKETEEHREGGETLKEIALIAIDVDFFKNINDTFGHAAGDEVLEKIATLFKGSIRDSDMAARVGGEEFMILLRNASASAAAEHAEEIRTKVERLSFDAYPDLKLTASFGVVSSHASTEARALKDLADKALYEAKHAGRNRVVTHGE